MTGIPRVDGAARSLPLGGHWRTIAQLRRLLAEVVLIPGLEALTGFRTASLDPPWLRLAMLTRRYEKRSQGLIRSLAQPGMVALDLGAHVGYYTVLLAGRVGPEGRVFAFEPHPEHLARLRLNASRFNNVFIEACAVSDTDGKGTLHDYMVESGSSSLYFSQERNAQRDRDDASPSWRPVRPERTFAVPTVALDTFLERHGVRAVDFVKLDIEGSEIAALRSMARVVRGQSPVLLIEFNPRTLAAAGHNPLDLLELLGDLGFESGTIVDDLTDRSWPVKLNHAQELCVELAAANRHVNLLCHK